MPTIDEVCRRTGVAWLALDGGRARPVWFLWHDDALWTVAGGAEQPLDVTATTAIVTVQDRDVLTWTGTVTTISPTSETWTEVVPLLHEKRLNPRDGEAQPQRWAAESTVLCVRPLLAP